LLGFPPHSHHILLPARSVAAARAALALYDATLLHQRVAVVGGDLLLRAGLGRIFGVRVPDGLDTDWWARWCHEVGSAVAGDVQDIAFRTWEDRIAGLLLDPCGRPLAFVKVWQTARQPSTGHPPTDLQADVITVLSQQEPASFKTPAIISEGFFDCYQYLAFEPLPAGRHRRFPRRPAALHRIIDELQERLAQLARPEGAPEHHVMSHGDLTPRNLRVSRDGSVWLFDWEYARWAPPLADELRFWVTDAALRPRPRPRRDGRRVLGLLLDRGSPADVAEALSWHEYVTPREAAIRSEIARELASRRRGHGLRRGGVRSHGRSRS
jgi:hypothetical protein